MADECHCAACDPIRIEVSPDGFLDSPNMRMILCAICGNKRCPHATDHRHACTNSNQPGQPGSAYGGLGGSIPPPVGQERQGRG